MAVRRVRTVRGMGRSQQSALAAAAAQLSAGQDAAFSTSLVQFFDQTTSEQDYWEWNAHGLWDPLNGYAHYFGKAAGQDTTWSHRYYIDAINTWFDGGTDMWENLGHIYGNVGLDESTGDVFIARGGMDGNSVDNFKRLRRWTFSNRSWNNLVPASQDIYASGLDSHANGVAVHPTLFGTGKPGVICDMQTPTLYVNINDDTRFSETHTSAQYGAQYGIGVYWPNQNCCIVGGAGGNALAKIVPNGTSTPTRTTFATPPISTEGNTRLASNFGSLLQHPTDPTSLILVEKSGTRWWKCNSAGTFDQRDDDTGPHPFTFSGPMVYISIPTYGIIWALGFEGTTPASYSRIWRPDA